MITPKIKALFQFIEYLHSNIDNFNLNNDLIKELELMNEERQKVSSKKTFKEKLKYDEVQAEIETKFKILQGNTANLIKAKAKELNVCSFDNEPNYSFYNIEIDIHQLKDNFSKTDLPEIFKRKQQYIEYRTKTHKTFLSLSSFFNAIDKITKNLFDFFKSTEHNEFEAFETKAIEFNNIHKAVEQFQKGNNKVSVSFNKQIVQPIILNIYEMILMSVGQILDAFEDVERIKNRRVENPEIIPFKLEKLISQINYFKNYVESEKIGKRFRLAPLTIDKDKIELLTQEVKISLDELNKLSFDEIYKDAFILIQEVKDYILKELIVEKKAVIDEVTPIVKALPPKSNKKQSNKLSDLITHQKNVGIVDCIKVQYKNIKGKQLKLLLLAFQELNLLPKERIAQKFYDCCKAEFDWDIASYNAMNGYNFNDETDIDELNSKKQYIETLIK